MVDAFDLLELNGTDLRREPIACSQGDAGQLLRNSSRCVAERTTGAP